MNTEKNTVDDIMRKHECNTYVASCFVSSADMAKTIKEDFETLRVFVKENTPRYNRLDGDDICEECFPKVCDCEDKSTKPRKLIRISGTEDFDGDYEVNEEYSNVSMSAPIKTEDEE